jgi:hypothetical protein
MTLRTRRAIAAGFFFCGLAFAGCGQGDLAASKGETPPEQMGLMEVGEMYTTYLKEHGSPPKKKADFEKYSPGFTFGSMGVQKGDLVVVWNAPKATDPSEAATKVLAYEKKTPKDGGKVLMQDGTIKEMTAQEFATAPKAAPAS